MRTERDETAKAYFDEIIDDFTSIKARKQWRSQPKIFVGQNFWVGPKFLTLGEQQYFCLGRRFSKQKNN